TRRRSSCCAASCDASGSTVVRPEVRPRPTGGTPTRFVERFALLRYSLENTGRWAGRNEGSAKQCGRRVYQKLNVCRHCQGQKRRWAAGGSNPDWPLRKRGRLSIVLAAQRPDLSILTSL